MNIGGLLQPPTVSPKTHFNYFPGLDNPGIDTHKEWVLPVVLTTVVAFLVILGRYLLLRYGRRGPHSTQQVGVEMSAIGDASEDENEDEDDVLSPFSVEPSGR